MITRRSFLKTGSLGLAAVALAGNESLFAQPPLQDLKSTGYISKRPEFSQRNFTSEAVEKRSNK
jgi:hypothetical protein